MKTCFNNVVSGLICCMAVVFNGYAAPTVKKLGIASINSNVNNNVKSVSINRTGSVHSVKNIGVVKPVQTVETVNKAKTARLSVGKYLHGAGVASGNIKPINTNTNVMNASVDEKILNLTNKIEMLEAKIENMQPKISVQDNVMSDVQVVKGLNINDENVIELNKGNIRIPVGGEDSDVAASIWVEQD